MEIGEWILKATMRKHLLAALALAATTVALAANGAEPGIIVVREQAAVAGCEHLGEVRGSSLFGGMMTNYAYGRALAAIKGKAQALGATHLMLLDSSSGFAGSNMLGQAYRCSAKAAPAGG